MAFPKLPANFPHIPYVPFMFREITGMGINQIPENFLFTSHKLGEKESRAAGKHWGDGTHTAMTSLVIV